MKIDDVMKEFRNQFGYIDHNQDCRVLDGLEIPAEDFELFLRKALEAQEAEHKEAVREVLECYEKVKFGHFECTDNDIKIMAKDMWNAIKSCAERSLNG